MNPRILRAVLWYDRGSIIEAEAELRAAARDGDDSSDLHAMIGLCLLRAGLKERAKGEVETALKLDPNNAFAYYSRSYVQQAELEFMSIPFLGNSPIDGLTARACVRSVLKAIELAPDDERYLVRLAEVHQLLGQWRKSLEPAENALSLSPDNVPAAIFRAEALARSGRSEEARVTLARALELNPEASVAHAGMGWALLRAGDHERATEFFNEALRLHANLQWAQGGALECAKHRYQIYRWLFCIKTWFAGRNMAVRAVLGLAAVAGLMLLMVGFLEFLDPFVRPRLGNKGTGLLFMPIVFGLIFLTMFHEYLFLWLVRRKPAARTTAGEERRSFARQHIGLMATGIGGAIVLIVVGEISKNWVAALAGLIPGGYLMWLTIKKLPNGVPHRGWTIYSAIVLMLGPVVGVVFRDQIHSFGRMGVLVALLLPVLPLAIALEFYRKQELSRKHDEALAARSREQDSNTRP